MSSIAKKKKITYRIPTFLQHHDTQEDAVPFPSSNTPVRKIGVNVMKNRTVNYTAYSTEQKCRAAKFIVRIWPRDVLTLQRFLC